MVLVTDPLFLAEFDENVSPGSLIELAGDEAHHAVSVKRLTVGQSVLLSNGAGIGVRGVVAEVGKRHLSVKAREVIDAVAPSVRWTVVQALAKGERSDLAVQMATELGAARIIAWQAARSIVRWQGERGNKALAKWRSTARESAKQARRFAVPGVTAGSTKDVVQAIAAADAALVLHENAVEHIAQVELPEQGVGIVIVGPEGGITADELEAFVAAGARPVLISDAVLRTSTAAAVALGQLDVVARR